MRIKARAKARNQKNPAQIVKNNLYFSSKKKAKILKDQDGMCTNPGLYGFENLMMKLY